MGKNTLKKLGAIFADIVETIGSVAEASGSGANGATYGMVVTAITKSNDISSFNKTLILEKVAKNADSRLYEAAIAVIEADNMSNFNKLLAIEHIFEGS